jgi:adenylate kinase family enzyme
MLSLALGACQLSTGDVFRAARTFHPDDLSPVMAEALEHMRQGELVSDEIVLKGCWSPSPPKARPRRFFSAPAPP